jgi:HEAT repeat protein
MCPRRALWLVAVSGLVVVARAAEPDPELVNAEAVLQEAKVETDGASLLRFFRDRTLTADDTARLTDAVRRLGDDDFDTREKASDELIRAGRKALPFLKAAERDKDPERARRVAQCLQEIESGVEIRRIVAAARVLRDRPFPGAAPVLLAYLPQAGDQQVEDALLRALLAVGVKEGKPDAALEKALTDKDMLRRVAAAYVLGRAVPEQRAAVRRLFADPEPRVRFEAALALAHSGDKEAVPALIALLADGPMPLGWRAQEILYRVAGDKAPTLALVDEDPAKRAAVAEAWRGWWKDAAPTTDLTKVNLDNTLQGINVICEIPSNEQQGRVWGCRADGKVLWEFGNIPGPVDAQLLPNGNILVGEWHTSQVTERDRTGKVVWTFKAVGSLASCQRLPNGNTFVGTVSEMTEVDPKGNRLYTRKDPAGSLYRSHRLPNGHIIYATNGRIVEIDEKGKEVRAVKIPIAANDWTSVELLPGDRFLVAVRGAGQVVEIDAQGKILWQVAVQEPMSVARLPNGNTLVACYNQNCKVVEFDQAKKEVWTFKVNARPFCIRRF